MSGNAGTEAFIRRAEAKAARRATNALLDAEEYLTLPRWLESSSTAEYYVEYRYQLERTLEFLLVNHEGDPPAILGFLAAAELEKHFPPIDPQTADYAALTATVKYVTAKVVAAHLSGLGVSVELQERVDTAFAHLWRLRGASKVTNRETLKAYEALLDLAFGRYSKVVQVFERELRFPLAELEGAARTLVKVCYLLAKIAAGAAGEDERFGARSCIAILNYDYYSWEVDEELSAQIDLPPVVLASWLYKKIANRASPTLCDVFGSMSPRSVLVEMQSLRGDPA